MRKFCCKISTSKFSEQKWYCWLCKMTDFDNKLKNFDIKVILNKTKDVRK